MGRVRITGVQLCLVCHKKYTRRVGKRFCSIACKQKHYRTNKKLKAEKAAWELNLRSKLSSEGYSTELVDAIVDRTGVRF